MGRCVPGLRSVISVPAGMAHMHLGLFIALTTTGSAVWNSVLIGGRHRAGQPVRGGRRRRRARVDGGRGSARLRRALRPRAVAPPRRVVEWSLPRAVMSLWRGPARFSGRRSRASQIQGVESVSPTAERQPERLPAGKRGAERTGYRPELADATRPPACPGGESVVRCPGERSRRYPGGLLAGRRARVPAGRAALLLKIENRLGKAWDSARRRWLAWRGRRWRLALGGHG